MEDLIYDFNFHEFYQESYAVIQKILVKLQSKHKIKPIFSVNVKLRNSIKSGVFGKDAMMRHLVELAEFSELSKINDVFEKVIFKTYQVRFPLEFRCIYHQKQHLFGHLEIPIVDNNLRPTSINLLQFKKYVVIIFIKTNPIKMEKTSKLVRDIENMIEKYSIIKEKYEFLIVLSEPFFQNRYFCFNPNIYFLPYKIAFLSRNKDSISVFDNYGTLIRSLGCDLYKTHIEGMFEVLLRSFVERSDYLLENFFLNFIKNNERNFEISKKILSELYSTLNTNLSKRIRNVNYNVSNNCSLKYLFDFPRLRANSKSVIMINSDRKYHQILENAVSESLIQHKLINSITCHSIHINKKLISQMILDYLKLEFSTDNIQSFIFRFRKMKLPKSPGKSCLTILFNQTPSIDNQRLFKLRNELNHEICKKYNMLIVDDVAFFSPENLQISNQFTDKELYKKYKNFVKINPNEIEKLKYFLNFHTLISKFQVYDSNFNLNKEVYGDTHITYIVKPQDEKYLINRIHELSGVNIMTQNKFINHQTRYIELISLEIKQICKVCNVKIEENDKQYYCWVCKVSLCLSCGNYINKKAVGMQRLLHEHNLIFIPRKSELINGIQKLRLGNNNMIGAETQNKSHNMQCSLCLDSKKKIHTRYLCIHCDFNNDRDDFVDFCGSCFKRFCLNYDNYSIRNSELDMKYKKFVECFNHKDNHCFLKIYFSSGNYYEY